LSPARQIRIQWSRIRVTEPSRLVADVLPVEDDAEPAGGRVELLAYGEVCEGELAVAAAEEREESKQGEPEGGGIGRRLRLECRPRLSLPLTPSAASTLNFRSACWMMAVMLTLILIGLLRGVRTQRALLLENLALRHQRAVLHRTAPRPRLRSSDRVSL
jgi:hypothetical protein